MALLDRGLERKLTLITAPAGSGKTTSLAAWVQQCDRRVCWLFLDGDEDEITRFFRYLIASLQTAWPGMGREALKSLRAAQAPNPRTALISLLNDAAEVQADFALVLDDFHTLKSQEIHVAVAFLVDRAPPQMHFFIGSRAAPPLPLGRLRAANQLVEIMPNLLNFNLQETRTFLNDSMQLQLVPETISRLQNQTEGWVTGLQLAALAAQTETSTELEHERDEYLEAFSGEQRHIFDYLGAEVLDQQEPRLQAFLLSSAILHRMSAGLCAAVVGTGEMSGSASRRSSQSMLEQLRGRQPVHQRAGRAAPVVPLSPAVSGIPARASP